MKNYWKRFGNIEKGLIIFFGIGLFIDTINKEFLNSTIPKEIVGCIFRLIIGLYLGFRLCRYEYIRVWKVMKKEEGNKNIPFTPN